ncbi:MAG: PQQ-binding-like beta-propeller repeat protein [Planctomycetaceae bacterium]
MSIRAPITGLTRLIPASVGMCRSWSWLLASAVLVTGVAVRADEPAPDAADDGVFLPTDRELERTLDKARRLLGESRWSDAATLFDEILAAPRDAFGSASPRRTTSRSLKTEAWAVLQEQPRAGRDAYELLFSARADRRLADAIAADDIDAIVEVARRWFATPAGRRAAVIAATTALEAGQPAVAAAWLDRLAEQKMGEPAEPTLSLMRSVAHAQAGDMATAGTILAAARGRDRVAGLDLALSLPPAQAAEWLATMARARTGRAAEWPQPRGDAARNATAVASRPLLVPRYRVPLARHPEEVRLLDKRRQTAAAAERFIMPAGTPVAVDGVILVRTPLGILAVDFPTGKRLWLRTLADQLAGPTTADEGADAAGGDATDFIFDDFTSASLTVAEGLVVAIETPPQAPGERGPLADLNNGLQRRFGEGGRRGNRLRAFDIAARGAARWQLPAPGSDAWYLGPPLAVGGELYALVEEKGEVRLDVVDAARGTVLWSRPLAELDEDEQISSPRARSRRLAGLSPALADGVLVCPLGAGTVVAVDLATRRLLWAHHYPRIDRPDADRAAANDASSPARRGIAAGDSLPVLAAGRVLLAAHDATGLACLDLRQGRPAWESLVPDVVQVAGVVDGRVIVIGTRAVEARALANGERLWRLSYADAGGRPSGRGILTQDRLLLPLDSPEVVEIDLRTGGIAGRCPARGGLVPGNLVAYRGEVISRGSDSLDVFHQQAALEARIQTAEARDPASPWAWQWRGQLQLEAGRVADGLELLGKAARADAARLPPEALPDAIVFGMQRDFAAAAPAWRAAFRLASLAPGGSAATRAAARVAVDGFLRVESWGDAWSAIHDLLATDPVAVPNTATRDPADQMLVVNDDRWIAGRLATLVERAPSALRAEIAAAAAAAIDAAAAASDAGDRQLRLERLAERLAGLPQSSRARALAIAAPFARGDDSAQAAIRTEWHLLHLARSSTGEPRARILATVAANRPASLRDPPSPAAIDAAWPLGHVDHRRLPIGRDTFAGDAPPRLMPLPVEQDRAPAVPGLKLACDVQEGRLHLFDGYGRPLMDPLTIDPAGSRLGLPWLPQANGFEAWTLGRLLFVRTGRVLSAYDLAGGSRPLWTHLIAGSAAEQQPAGLWVRAVGGRGARHGGTPLGLEINEPDERSRTGLPRGGRPRITGALHQSGGTLSLVESSTGGLLWERHALPAGGELVGDDEFVTACTPGGADSRVLSMLDGRLVRTVRLPPRRRRLMTCGRRIVAVCPLEDGQPQGTAAKARLELVDPVNDETIVLGTVAGAARAVPLDDDRLLVLAPDGRLTAFDLASGQEAFATQLPAMPAAFDRLHVVPWLDRLLIVAGTESRTDAGEWHAGLDDLAPLQHLLAAGEISRPLSGSVWSVDSTDGRLLWPGPATLAGHCLHLAQPDGLPVLLLSRQMRSRPDAEHVRLSLVGLDKRTGHAVFDEIAQPIQPHVFFGCELVGDPERHSITIRESGETPRWAVLDFTGGSVPPRGPYQAHAAAPGMDRLLEQIQSRRRQRP